MREIVLDTETTGLDPATGHRLVEVACVEVLNLVPTGQTFHVYINPERDMPQEAYKIHGLSREFLQNKPLFVDVASEFIQFVRDSRLIIHNAEFDMKFINFELIRIGRSGIVIDKVFDTLSFARKKHPGASNSLDALCTRYKINNAKRIKHGALLDAELLAEVYAELMGGRQTRMSLGSGLTTKLSVSTAKTNCVRENKLASAITIADIEAHACFLLELPKNSVWRDFFYAP